jgi:hypothetical protein
MEKLTFVNSSVIPITIAMRLAFALLITLLFSNLAAQSPVRQITLDLNPIAIENGRYYFNGKRVTFDGLLIPLQAVDDKQVNRSIKTALALRTSQTVVRLGLSVYLLYLIADQPLYVNYHQTRTFPSPQSLPFRGLCGEGNG